MAGYYCYSPRFFDGHIDALIHKWGILKSGKCQNVIDYFKTKGLLVKSYQVRKIPKQHKRGPQDSAVLLMLYLENGALACKRHNNSQYLNISLEDKNGRI